MAYCPDCGLQAMSQGICSNCQEELYIMTYQSDVCDEGFSEEFAETADEQRRYVNEHPERIKATNLVSE